jgi:hypothetical protein
MLLNQSLARTPRCADPAKNGTRKTESRFDARRRPASAFVSCINSKD